MRLHKAQSLHAASSARVSHLSAAAETAAELLLVLLLLNAAVAAAHCLQVRGPIVVERYHKAAAPAVDEGGWFATGDVASIDEHGMMRIADR
jgi:acyl-CoA synthetase (AMP-forming)/AMP-acid ligase II